MKRARPKPILLALLLAAVILGALIAAAVFGYRAYKEHQDYELTAHFYIEYYLLGVLSILDVVELEEGEYSKTPIDLKAMVDDLRIVPPENPYTKDHKTLFTTFDKWVPGAVWYIPGPVETPELYAIGLFLNKRRSGRDMITEGDDIWIIGWGLSKPDGILDGTDVDFTYGIRNLGQRRPLFNLSEKWEQEWFHRFEWKYSDGTIIDPYDKRFQLMFEDYYRRHPENFVAEKRSRMPDGFDVSSATIYEVYKRKIISFYQERKADGSSKAEDEKAKK